MRHPIMISPEQAAEQAAENAKAARDSASLLAAAEVVAACEALADLALNYFGGRDDCMTNEAVDLATTAQHAIRKWREVTR